MSLDREIGERFIITFDYKGNGELSELVVEKTGKYNLNVEVESLKGFFELEASEMDEIKQFAQVMKFLKKGERFTHPLAEISTVKGQEVINSYGVISVFCSLLFNREEALKDGAKLDEVRELLSSWLMIGNPQCLVESLLQKVEMGDVSAFMKVATIASEGFQAKCKQAEENGQDFI